MVRSQGWNWISVYHFEFVDIFTKLILLMNDTSLYIIVNVWEVPISSNPYKYWVFFFF